MENLALNVAQKFNIGLSIMSSGLESELTPSSYNIVNNGILG